MFILLQQIAPRFTSMNLASSDSCNGSIRQGDPSPYRHADPKRSLASLIGFGLTDSQSNSSLPQNVTSQALSGDSWNPWLSHNSHHKHRIFLIIRSISRKCSPLTIFYKPATYSKLPLIIQL